ncbi:EamA family transporter [Meridianimarinicoccus sp. RP-17]|uniref:DMT family transporter n=1 Tax=Meridianimarinicoccus zhengii TaxID=2056810 RepID=UPI000DACD7A3|nr:DMT family transporter [Phycocomes zhengii]
MTERRPGLGLAVLCAATMTAFAANSLLNRLALVEGETGPAAFAALRLAAGAAILCALVLCGPNGMTRVRSGLRVGHAAALAAYMVGFSFAYVTLDAGLGALILFGTVQITMFAGGVVAGDTISARRWLGAGLAMAGLAGLLWPAGSAAPPFAGAALMTAAGIGWGIFSLKGRGGRDPLGTMAGSFLLALPAGLLALTAVGGDGLGIRGALLAVVSGAVTSGLGYALWYRVLPQIASSTAAVLQLSVPVIAMAGGAALLGEAVGLRAAVAAVVVLAGIALAVTAPSAPARRG